MTPQTFDLTVPPSDVVVDILEGFRRSKAMFAAVSLGVFDLLDELGSATLDSISTKLGCDPDALKTLLNACVSMLLLNKVDEQYSNTSAATTYLCKRSPRRMTGYINYSNDVAWKLWEHLEDAVREGSNRWKQTYGTDGPIFSQFFRNEEAKTEFLMGMNGFGQITSPVVVQAFDLSSFKQLVDLGGATGHLAIAACKRYPTLRATVFDLPNALDLANKMVAESGICDRLRTTGGDFFEDELPEADLYALGRIIHDWDLPKINRLLNKIYDSLPSGGGLLIAEKLIDEDRNGPRSALLQSLNMLVCTEGRERTFGEYCELLSSIGFKKISCVRTTTPIDAVLAVK